MIHSVHSTDAMKTKMSGLVVFEASGKQIFRDIEIDGVTAYDTNRWSGIVVSGLGRGLPRNGPRSRDVVIRNSVVYRVYGDGIILFGVQNGVIERSAAWYTGMEPKYSIGTPNSIWTWTCADCIVRETEGFFSDSPGVDGGVYDIDWANDRNLVENNYGHDSQAYCVAVFGANGVTTASEIRGNVCAGTGRSPRRITVTCIFTPGTRARSTDCGFMTTFSCGIRRLILPCSTTKPFSPAPDRTASRTTLSFQVCRGWCGQTQRSG